MRWLGRADARRLIRRINCFGGGPGNMAAFCLLNEARGNRMSDQNAYPAVDPVKSGVAGRCPRCGEGKLFDGFLKVAPRCSACGLDYSFADSGDGPAAFVILII